jgi:hypothetical protein
MQPRTKLALGLGVAALLLIGVRVFISLATPQEVDPRVRIEQMFAEGKRAFENEDIDGMLQFLADEFSWSGMDKQRLRYQLAQFFRNAQDPRAELGELQMEILRRAHPRAHAYPHHLARLQHPQRHTTRMDLGVVEFEFRKFPQRKWLIIRYDDWRLIRMEATQMGDIPL